MKVLLILFVLALTNSANASSLCPTGQQATLVQTGMQFDMYWIGTESSEDDGNLISFSKAISEVTVCHSNNQTIRIRDYPTNRWYKLHYRDGALKELEAMKDKSYTSK